MQAFLNIERATKEGALPHVVSCALLRLLAPCRLGVSVIVMHMDACMQKCVKDKEYCEEVLEAIDGLTKTSIEGIFEDYEEIKHEIGSLVI